LPYSGISACSQVWINLYLASLPNKVKASKNPHQAAVDQMKPVRDQQNAIRSASNAAVAVATLGLTLSALPSAAFPKTPGATYCFNRICHRVKTIEEVQAQIGREETVVASFYDHCKVDPGNPCTPLSSGEELHADRPDNAASPVYPNGTILVLLNPKNNATARVRVNNSGPYSKGRLLDVSRATAVQLGFFEEGMAQLTVTVVREPAN
jgi:rare lipoprotein A